MQNYDSLKLKNQLCFPLYACSKEITRQYREFLEPLDLTYPQYIVLMVLWEYNECSVKSLGDILYLDSGTLTPVLKTLEKKGFITRRRFTKDERVLIVTITDAGLALRDEVLKFPRVEAINSKLTSDETAALYRILYKLLK